MPSIRILLTLMMVLALLALTVVGGYLAVPWLAAKYAPSLAEPYGIEINTLVISRPGWTGITVAHLEAATEDVSVSLHDGVIGYSLPELLDGRLRELEIAQLQLVRRQREALPPSPQPPTLAFDPAGLFALVPFQQVAVAHLTTALPALDFRSTGSLLLRDGQLTVDLTGLAPEAAEDLRLSGKLSDQGNIELDLSAVNADAAASFVSVSSLITGDSLAVTAQVNASGFPFALLSAAAGMPAGEGRLVGQMQTTLPWPVNLQDLLDAEMAGEFELDWRSADGVITVSELAGSAQRSGAAIQARFSAGRLQYQDDENAVTANINDSLRADWDGLRLQVSEGISYRLQAADADVSGELRSMMLVPENQQPLTAELGASIQVDDLLHSGDMKVHGAMSGSVISAEGVWTTGGWVLPFALQHDISEARGELKSTAVIELDRPLATSLLAPWQELYDLHGGTLSYSAATRWSDDVVVELALALDDVTAIYDDYLLSGIDSELEMSWQDNVLKLKPAELTARLFDPGVPFTDLTTRVALHNDQLQISDTVFELLGGRVNVGDLVYDLTQEKTLQPVLVELQQLALGQLLALEGDSISGEGQISGQLPIEIRGGLPSIPKGEVMALDPGGLLQLSDELSSVSGQPGLDFALEALTNYRFTSLVAGVEYSEDGELKLAIALQGSNPEVENGRPIHYNLNITENVLVLLRSLRAQRVVTDGLERRVFN